MRQRAKNGRFTKKRQWRSYLLPMIVPTLGLLAGWGGSAIHHLQTAAIRDYQDSVHDAWVDKRIRRVEDSLWAHTNKIYINH